MSSAVASASEPRAARAPAVAPLALLVLANAFVGAMVGVERSVLSLDATQVFGLASWGGATAVAVFGATKALTNLRVGALASGTAKRRLLITGWLVALPIPLLLGLAPSWTLVLVANALLGVSQGITWSVTLLMKLDRVGPRRRGLAVALNESAGYLSVGVAAYLASVAAATIDARLGPALLAALVAAGGLATALLTTDVPAAVSMLATARAGIGGTWLRRASVYQAGFANNLNDGMAFAFVPVFLAERGATLEVIGLVAGAYPAVWGVGQLVTGPLSDRVGRRRLIVPGLALQALAIVWLGAAEGVVPWTAAAALWGTGTALVYPTLLAAAADLAPPGRIARVVGVYRFWRDAGVAVGAVAGALATATWDLRAALLAGAAVTAASALLMLVEELAGRRQTPPQTPA